MKEVNLLLEDDEIMILRGQARFMAMMPEAFGSGGGRRADHELCRQNFKSHHTH